MSAPLRQLSRHMTADGRVSLKSHLAGPRATPLATQFRTKVFKKDLYPLAACVGGAVVLGSGFAMRHLFTSPNVTVNKAERKATLLTQNKERAANHLKHRSSMRNIVKMVEQPK